MNKHNTLAQRSYWRLGLRDATPLLGGYIPVAMSFGIIANQAGFSVLEATLISTLIYAGASQFLLVAMIAAGTSLWLAVLMTLLINVRHIVYAPNITPWISTSRWWWLLMHGLTDQVFALAHTRLPELPESARLKWFTGASLLAWLSWILGTTLGAVAGTELTQHWPMLNEIMPFALPALFLVLLRPRFSTPLWYTTLGVTICFSLILTILNLNNLAIPAAAIAGGLVYSLLQGKPSMVGRTS